MKITISLSLRDTATKRASIKITVTKISCYNFRRMYKSGPRKNAQVQDMAAAKWLRECYVQMLQNVMPVLVIPGVHFYFRSLISLSLVRSQFVKSFLTNLTINWYFFLFSRFIQSARTGKLHTMFCWLYIPIIICFRNRFMGSRVCKTRVSRSLRPGWSLSPLAASSSTPCLHLCSPVLFITQSFSLYIIVCNQRS